MKKYILSCLLACVAIVAAKAQVSNTLSPYSQYGVGTLADQSLGFSRGMAGVSYGIRDSKHPNVMNPASYSAVDSLTMVFDIGLSGQITNFKEGAKRMNAKTADFDYAVMMFRVMPRLGAALGVVPYSNVGYNFYDAQWIGTAQSTAYGSISNNYYNTTYTGSGGFSQAFLGLGWEMFKGLSVGANMSYFWGKMDKSIACIFSDSYANTLTRTYTINVNSWKLDLGAQYSTMVGKQDRLTVGATAGIGHKLGADSRLTIVNTNSQTNVSTTSTDSVQNALSIPFAFGAGFSLLHNNRLTLAADYTYQRWGALSYPTVNETTKRYVATDGLLKDRHKIAVGMDWIPNPEARKLLGRVHYRLGVAYATPYYKIGALDGPKELTVSGGFSIPIINTWNNRTALNISAQWVRTAAKDLITENTFRINIGLTFNERWFAKWKVD